MSQLDDPELEAFRRDGFLMRRGLFSPDETARLRDAIPRLIEGEDADDQLHREREHGGAVRQVYLAHRHVPEYRDLSRDPRLLEPVKQLLGGSVYVWHSKLNVKAPFEGTVWLWHQDYGYWMWDGVGPRLISVMVLLEQATVNNGCLMLVAGSHRWGRQEHYADTTTTSYKQWTIDVKNLRERLREEDIQHVTGEPGDVLLFDCNLVHGSGHNMSPLPRSVFIVAYNHLDNKPQGVEDPRPDWVVSRQFDAL